MTKKPILYDIKIATGMAIILVVIGHLASRGEEGIDMYINLKRILYKFHMPLFLFLSGSIAYYTYKPIKSIEEYLKFIKKKFFRLFPAYLMLSFAFFIGKYIVFDDFDTIQSLLSILFYPSAGSSGFLWYIYVLFLYYLSMPLLYYMVQNRFWLFLGISLLLSSFVSFPKLLSLDMYFWYLPFFIFGCYSVKERQLYVLILKRFGLIIFLLFFTWSILEFFTVIEVPKNIISFFAIIGVGYLSLVKIDRHAFLENIGDNSFYIYLFNTMIIGAFTVGLVKWLGKELFITNFYYIAPIMIIIGVLLPIVLHKYIISRIPILKNLIS